MSIEKFDIDDTDVKRGNSIDSVHYAAAFVLLMILAIMTFIFVDSLVEGNARSKNMLAKICITASEYYNSYCARGVLCACDKACVGWNLDSCQKLCASHCKLN